MKQSNPLWFRLLSVLFAESTGERPVRFEERQFDSERHRLTCGRALLDSGEWLDIEVQYYSAAHHDWWTPSAWRNMVSHNRRKTVLQLVDFCCTRNARGYSVFRFHRALHEPSLRPPFEVHLLELPKWRGDA
jgi:hypothetical protein